MCRAFNNITLVLFWLLSTEYNLVISLLNMAPAEENVAHALPPSQLPYVSPLPSLKLTDKPRAEWNRFKQQYEMFEKIVELAQKDASYQCAMFLNNFGPKGLVLYNSLDFTEGENYNMKVIKDKCESYILGKTNVRESIANYVSILRDLSQTCNFCNYLLETLLGDGIVLGIKCASTIKVFLQKRKMTLKDTVDIWRSPEVTQQ